MVHKYLLSAILLRIGVQLIPGIREWFSDRPEISTPSTSWNRAQEGVALLNVTSLQHVGDSYHGSLLQLLFVTKLKEFSPICTTILFAVCDAVTGLALYKFGTLFLTQELKSQSEVNLKREVNEIFITRQHVENTPTLLLILYLFNPFTIATCIAKSTVTFGNLFLGLLSYALVKGDASSIGLFLALSTYEMLYPAQLIAVACICCWKYQKEEMSIKYCSILVVSWYLMWIFILFSISYFYSHGASIFMHYQFILSAPDLTPNIGVFWYFFTEVFDHFQTFFLCVFQLNVMIYSIPLTIKFRSHPIFLMFILCGVMCVFKSYPSLGDVGFWLSLVPLWSHTFTYLRHLVVTSVMLITTTVLCPIMWNMWIDADAANANFYFAATLTFSTAQVFILSGMTIAYLKWNYHIHEGLELKMEKNNKIAEIRLLN